MIQKLLSIGDIVKDKLFKIPDYQRGYSWEKEQIEDLLKDIEQISNKDHKHYTGTIVITKNNTDERYDIVDGQQRLTTLFIILKVIYSYNKVKFEAIESEFLIRKSKYILETNHDTEAYFKEAIIGDVNGLPTKIKSLQNLKQAKDLISNWVKNNEAKLDSYYDTIISKLGFICFSPNNSDEVGIMFEVINNRGKALSELEKIKNYFIYYATIHKQLLLKEKVNNNWGTILEYLNKAKIVSNDDENRYLRNCYIVFFSSNKSKSWDVYEQLKQRYPTSDDDIENKVAEINDFINFLLKCSKYYSFFESDSNFNSEYDKRKKIEIASILKRIRCHPINASILPLYLSIMTQLDNEPEVVLMLLKLLEIVNFRLYVLPNSKISRADSKQGDLFYWAHEFYRDLDWHSNQSKEEYLTWYGKKKVDGDIYEWLRMELIEFVKYHCPEETFIQSLTTDDNESIDYYNWNGLRFFLASYEEYLNADKGESWNIEKILINRMETEKDKGNDYLSKEHIWAKKNRPIDFPEDHREKRRLGNFVLIGLKSNIQLNNEDIEKKVKFLTENTLKSMRQVDQLTGLLDKGIQFANSRRDKKTKYYFSDIANHIIDQRETNLIGFALDRWKLPNEEMNTFDKVDSYRAWSERLKTNYFLKS